MWIIYISNALSTFSFMQKWMYMDLHGNWTGLTCDQLQPVFHRSFHFTQNHAISNWTDPNRAWTATAVQSKPVAVQSSYQFFRFSWTRLLNSSHNTRVVNVGWDYLDAVSLPGPNPHVTSLMAQMYHYYTFSQDSNVIWQLSKIFFTLLCPLKKKSALPSVLTWLRCWLI